MPAQEERPSMMMTAINLTASNVERVCVLPVWVPKSVRHYLAHTDAGLSIREIARETNCHASTIMRQIRKIEQRRDDPLVDAALRQLGSQPGDATVPVDARTLAHEGMRILRCLCERGALLAVAEGMEKAIVVRDSIAGDSTRTGVVDRPVAEAMALKGWIATKEGGKISRYRITNAGRNALVDLMARAENAKMAGNEREQDEDFGLSDLPVEETAKSTRKRQRYNSVESPIAGLARRRDRDGQPFLSADLVHAGEKLREEYELAQMAKGDSKAWRVFLASSGVGEFSTTQKGRNAADDARARVAEALRELGPGLADVILRCCCYLEGLEDVEKALGWSARSGKIVLRIGLQRLQRHFDAVATAGGGLIG